MIGALTVVLWVAIVLNLALLIVELAAGIPIYAANLAAIAICAMALWMLRT